VPDSYPRKLKKRGACCWESQQQRRETSENSLQSHEQLNKEKKEKTQDLTSFDNLPTSSEQGERVLIEAINYRFQVTNIGDNISLYSQRSDEEKIKNT